MNQQQHYRDTYFFDSRKALQIAIQSNTLQQSTSIDTPCRIFMYEESQQKDQEFYKDLQICYYNGDEVENGPDNLINLPIENIAESFKTSKLRYPEVIDFEGLEADENTKQEIILLFRKLIDDAERYKKILAEAYGLCSMKSHLNFNEPLRFFLVASNHTEVMQYISRNIANAIKKAGFDVMLITENNKMEIVQDWLILKSLAEFNPHVTININHFNNKYLNRQVFNFVWFQDAMRCLIDDTLITKRTRDKVFSLIYQLKLALLRKNIMSTIQTFMVDEEIYKPRSEIKKIKKIVFIGSSYANRLDEIKNDVDFDIVLEDAKQIFDQTGCLRGTHNKSSEILVLMQKHNKTEQYIQSIYAYLMRDYCIEKLCQIQSPYKIEIYGNGFEDNAIIKPFYMGPVNNGEQVSKIYNSATYGFCPGGYVLMQRTLECAFSGTVPLVLDTRLDKQDEDYDQRTDDGIEFFKLCDIEKLLNKDQKKDKNLNFIVTNYGYNKFIENCINYIQMEVRETDLN